ncbi:MAG: hypothetical protein V4687_05445 [Bacteroidota bacterium]
MKKIIVLVAVLFIAIVTMAYLYFSGLNFEQKSNEHSLYVAASLSPLILSFENDQSIIDILQGQDLLEEIIGEKHFKQIKSLKDHLLNTVDLGSYFAKQTVYISIVPAADKGFDFLYSTQINPTTTAAQLVQSLKANKIQIDQRKQTIQLSDSTVFYFNTTENLVVFSTSQKLVNNAVKVKINKENSFASFIKANSRITKNSLAGLYLNFQDLPKLLKHTMPGKLTGELSALNNENAYAALVYNYSKDKVLLTGVTQINKANSYYKLFTGTRSQKITITNVLPENTANYIAYTIDKYSDYRIKLKVWQKSLKEDYITDALIKNTNNNFRIDLEQLFPKYFKDQLITFQLSNGDKFGAINLSNGDKLEQLLLDISSTYSDDIKVFLVNDALYSFFGEPFRKFKKPYFTIVDNYLMVSNSANGLQAYLENYRAGRLLINTKNFTNTQNQLPAAANVDVYVNLANSEDIAHKNIYLPFFRHLYSNKGLKSYGSISYQLSSDNGKFLTNFLVTKKLVDSNHHSLTILP